MTTAVLDWRSVTGRLGALGRRWPPLVLVSAVILAVLVVVALTAHWLMPTPIDRVDLLNRYAPPIFIGGTWEHPLGTDGLGVDMLSLILRATQVSLSIAFLGTALGAVFGTAVGFLAAHLGGVVDAVVGILIDFQAAIPFLVLALAILAVVPDADVTTFIVLMCIYGWERYARLARGLAISAKSEGYVLAQRNLGASATRSICGISCRTSWASFWSPCRSISRRPSSPRPRSTSLALASSRPTPASAS